MPHFQDKLVDAAAVLTAFLGGAMAILVSVPDNFVMLVYRELGLTRLVVAYFKEAFCWTGLVMIESLGYAMVGHGGRWFAAIEAATLLATGVALWRVFALFFVALSGGSR